MLNSEMQFSKNDIQYLPHLRNHDDMKINHTNKLIKSDAIGEFKLEEINKEAIERTLKYYNNNRRAAAQALGMSERTLYRKITEFGLEPKIKRK